MIEHTKSYTIMLCLINNNYNLSSHTAVCENNIPEKTKLIQKDFKNNREVQILHSTVDSIEKDHIIFIPADGLFHVTGFINGEHKCSASIRYHVDDFGSSSLIR